MKILFATDGSEASLHAIREAARLLPLAAAEVHVVAVANVLALVMGYEATAIGSTVMIDNEEAVARAHADRAVALLAGLGVAATPHMRDGDPWRQIVAAAEALAPDLLVIGAHGKGALERLLVGSTSDAVVHHWPGAVLVIGPKPA